MTRQQMVNIVLQAQRMNAIIQDLLELSRLESTEGEAARDPIDVPRMQTNLVFFEVTKPGWSAARLVDACREQGVGIGANTATRIRAVTHLDVNRKDIDIALKVISDALAA